MNTWCGFTRTKYPQAEQFRLISIAKRRPSRVNSYYAQIMTWLGNLLCSWGSQLAVRFGKKTESFQSGGTDQKLNV